MLKLRVYRIVMPNNRHAYIQAYYIIKVSYQISGEKTH